MMAGQFRKFSVDHELITIDGGEHGLAGGDPKRIEQAYKKVLQFVHERIVEE
jgi:dipeptidyl aminopeptidase/acylaminoacyl peptidase